MMDKTGNIWLLFVTIFIITFVYTIYNYSYDKCLNYFGSIENGTIKVMILKDDIEKITSNLIIDKKNKKCILSKISNDYVLDDNYNKYYEVSYKCDLTDIKIDDYVFKLKINLGKTTIMNNLKQKIKKGIER